MLGDDLTGLDRRNLALVLAAISHANGSHEHHEYVPDEQGHIGPGSPPPRVEHGPLYAWPDEA